MKSKFLVILFVGIGVSIFSRPLVAHHGYAAYDTDKKVTLKGTVTKVDRTNQHVYYYIDFTDEVGKITNCVYEMVPQNGQKRAGWTRNTLHVGDEVTVAGGPGSSALDREKWVGTRW